MTNPTSNYGFVLPTATDLVTDLPADFDVALQGVDTRLKALNPETTLGDLSYGSATANTNTRLPIGTTGQVLAVSGGVPTWTTTADVTPLTTKGDLFTYTTQDARLGVGTNGQVLKANSATATGLEWGSAAAGKSYSLLGTGTLTSGSTVTVSGISGIDSIRVIINSASATASAGINFRINGDTAANYRNVFLSIAGTGTYTPQFLSSQSSAASWFTLANMNDAAGGTDNVSGYLQIDGCNTSGIKMVQGAASGGNVVGNNPYGRVCGGFWDNSATITSVSLVCNTGTFDAGTFSVYGAA